MPRSMPSRCSSSGSTHARSSITPLTSKSGFTRQGILDAVPSLEELGEERRAEKIRYAPSPDTADRDSDEKEDTPSRVLDEFSSTFGSERILKLTNFSPSQLNDLWNDIASYMLSHWNVWRGGQVETNGKACTLASLKHSGQWEVVAGIFHIQPPPRKDGVEFLRYPLSLHLRYV